jgi:O-antigen ligase
VRAHVTVGTPGCGEWWCREWWSRRDTISTVPAVRVARITPVTCCGVALAAAAVGGGVVLSPLAVLAATAAVALVSVVVLRPLWTAHIALFLAATTLPAALPYYLITGPTALFLFEPLLYAAAVYVLLKHPPGRAAIRCVVVFALLLVIPLVHGYVVGHSVVVMLREARGLGAVGAALIVSAGLIGTRHARGLLTTLCVSLWTSAVFTVLGSAVGLPLNGRIENTGLFINGFVEGTVAVRLLTPASHVADAVLSACLALLVTGRVGIRRLLPFLVPTLVISFLGFSRNTILAIAAAMLVAVVVDRSRRTVVGVFRVLGMTVVTVAVLVGFVASNAPGSAWVSLQGDAFYERVLVGAFDSDVRARDSSAAAREVENQFAVAAIRDAPVLGHGLGYAYRPAYGPRDTFTATVGPYYVHDFYLWVLVKAGVVGLALWLLVALQPLLAHLRRVTSRGVAFAGATAGLLVVCVVAPLPTGIDDGGSLVTGVLLGGLVARDVARDVARRSGGAAPRGQVTDAPAAPADVRPAASVVVGSWPGRGE